MESRGYEQKRRKHTQSGRILAKRRRARKIRRIKRVCGFVCVLLVLGIGWSRIGTDFLPDGMSRAGRRAEKFLSSMKKGSLAENYPQDLLDMLEKNEETYEFVTGYPNRAEYMEKDIDMTDVYKPGEVPLLMQWDQRWGYNSYGEDMIGVAGCGPACMTMAYLYLTGDMSMNPRRMAEYAYNSGFYSEAGTSWSFFTEGAADLGLSGSEIPLGETEMKNTLDNGGLLVCSMRPGDFTTTGHFILLRGYDANGFYVNDPNSRKNSEKQWDYDTLYPQIKCLWRLEAE